ncbi:unnamed protein product, partial [Heterotrigona itama]
PKSSNGTNHHVDQEQREESIERKDIENFHKADRTCTESTLFSPSSHHSKSFTSSGWTLANDRITGGKMGIRIDAVGENRCFSSDRSSLVGNQGSNFTSKFPKSPIPFSLAGGNISILASGILTTTGKRNPY